MRRGGQVRGPDSVHRVNIIPGYDSTLKYQPMATPVESTIVASIRRRPPRDVRRLYVVGIALFMGLVVISGRLIKLQIIDGDRYAEQARRQYESKMVLQAERGALYDRGGNLLATNAMSISFAADPKHIENPQRLAKIFADALGDPYEVWLGKLTQKNTSFVWLHRKVSGPALERLKDLDDDGLIKLKEPLRHFEYASLGAQAIGATDIDNNGLNGVELYYDEQLKGSDGYVVMQRDARGRRRPDVDLPQVRPQHGSALVLTLDVNVQAIVEDELRKGVERAGALSGTAIAIDPHTGELLALASYPTYDPNDMRSAEQAAVRVRAITDTYEPGSTIKVVTVAAALEEGEVDPDEKIDCENGLYKIAGHIIRDDHPAGTVSFREAMSRSSNIAMAKVASRISAPRFYKYVRDFGFGIISGVDLPGEARGEVKKPDEFSDGTQEFMAFGYQLAVTPLQLVCAYAAVANGGVMMKPHLLKRRLDRNGEVLEEFKAQEIRRVISPKTARTLCDMLVQVVDSGTGKAARINGMKIAGKTGTSQQIFDGAYSKEKYNASFVGFFPADQPRVTLLVLLDSPTNGYYGGQVAAPIFREIARRIMGASVGSEPSRPTYAASEAPALRQVTAATSLETPDLRGLDADAARMLGEKYGCRVLVRGAGRLVMEQTPAPGTRIEARSVIVLALSAPENDAVMPDLRGLSLRRALNILSICQVKPHVSGSGIVRSQSPAPGTPFAGGAARSASLVCR